MQSVSDFDFINAIEVPVKEAAVADQRAVGPNKDRERRWPTGAIPREKFVENSLGLFAGVNAERKAHEILVGHQSGKNIDIFFAEWSQS
jgi:hypothetical protein